MSGFQLNQVSFSYGGPAVLRELTLQIKPGEFVGILGPNGAGKSSLLRVLAGLRPASSGTVLFENQEIHRLPALERAKKIALVPQWTVMTFSFTAFEIVLMGRHPHLQRLCFESARDLEIAEKAMEATDTLRFRDRYFGELSGGEMQRLIIARAIAQDTPAILLDEPSSALDIAQQQRIYEILKQRNERGTTVIVTTHDLNLAAKYCRRILLLDHGALAADGSAEEVLQEELIEKIYSTPVQVLQSQGQRFVLPKS